MGSRGARPLGLRDRSSRTVGMIAVITSWGDNCLYRWLESSFVQMILPGIYIHLIHPCGFPYSFLLNSKGCWESMPIDVEERLPNTLGHWGRISEFDGSQLPFTPISWLFWTHPSRLSPCWSSYIMFVLYDSGHFIVW
jgi:hypothetical protein